MSTTEQDVASRLGWGIRRYFLVIVAALVATLGLALTGPADSVLTPDRSYEASALVVARQLTIRPEQFPRAAEAVFAGGSVAEAVADQVGGDIDPGVVIPNLVRLEPVTDTIALRVIGRHRSPGRAAALANLTADAFVMELNQLGPGVGEFAVQDQARPPLQRPNRTSIVVPAAVGGVSGLALGLGLIGLLLTLRRPVVDVREAAEAAGGGELLAAVVELPSARRRLVRPEEVSGLALLVSQLFPGGAGVGALIGCGRDRHGMRTQVLRLVALLGARRSPVILLVTSASGASVLSAATRSETNVRVVEDWFVQRLEASGPPPEMGTDGTMVLVGVSADEFDVPQLLPDGARSLLFVTEGLRRSHVERAASQFAHGALDGVVFCRRLRRPRRARKAAAAGRRLASTAPRGRASGRSGIAAKDPVSLPQERVSPPRNPATPPRAGRDRPAARSSASTVPVGPPRPSQVPPTGQSPQPRVGPPSPPNDPARPVPVGPPQAQPRVVPASPSTPTHAAPPAPHGGSPPRPAPTQRPTPGSTQPPFDVLGDDEPKAPKA